MSIKQINGTVVNGVSCPTLAELKSHPCTLEELQAAIVQLAEIVNYNAAKTAQGRHDASEMRFDL